MGTAEYAVCLILGVPANKINNTPSNFLTYKKKYVMLIIVLNNKSLWTINQF